MKGWCIWALWFVVFAVYGEEQRYCGNDDLLGELCLSLEYTDECHVNIDATINGEVKYSELSTIQDLASSPATMCMGEDDCSICYQWNVILDNRGGAIATATFTGSCLNSTLELGPYEDLNIELCPKSCLNSCSGRGRCNYSGICNCGLGYYGEDCSLTENCNGSRTNVTNIDDVSKVYEINGDYWKGYATGVYPLAEMTIHIEAIEGVISAWTMKSCLPDPENNVYDSEITNLHSEYNDGSTLPLSSNCDEITGGIWFVLVSCTSSNSTCKFSIKTIENRISILSKLDNFSIEALDRDNIYFGINVSSIDGAGIHIDITAEQCDIGLISLLPEMCPSSSLALSRVSTPSENTDTYCKYKLFLNHTQDGLLYVLVEPSKLSDDFLVLSVSKSDCINCGFGYCNDNDTCNCITGYEGPNCNSPIVTETNSPEDKEITITQIIITIIVLGLAAIIVSAVAIIIAKIIFRKKPQPPDNLFAMLAQEQDLDLM